MNEQESKDRLEILAGDLVELIDTCILNEPVGIGASPPRGFSSSRTRVRFHAHAEGRLFR